MENFSDKNTGEHSKRMHFLKNMSMLLVIAQIVLVITGIYRVYAGLRSNLFFGAAILLAVVVMILGRNIRKLQAELEQKN